MNDPTIDNPHDEAEELLPWYVTGRLDQPIASASRGI